MRSFTRLLQASVVLAGVSLSAGAAPVLAADDGSVSPNVIVVYAQTGVDHVVAAIPVNIGNLPYKPSGTLDAEALMARANALLATSRAVALLTGTNAAIAASADAVAAMEANSTIGSSEFSWPVPVTGEWRVFSEAGTIGQSSFAIWGVGPEGNFGYSTHGAHAHYGISEDGVATEFLPLWTAREMPDARMYYYYRR